MGGSSKHLVRLRGKRPEEIRALLASARDLTSPTGAELGGATVANLFFEDSTRTRVSFTIAAQRLGASVVDLSGRGSSLSKGETLLDTARTVEAMGVDALVVRCGQSGGAELIARGVSCAVVNAGDGRHEHPTQALTDALTLSTAMGRASDFDLSGVRVAIVGDCAASRVARSNIACLRALGAAVVCCGPAPMAPPALAALGCSVSRDLDEVVGEVDAVMTLRIQFERSSSIGSAREYRERWGLTGERAERMRPGAWVMHPGPVNRGLEIDGEVADGERSLVLGQVANGPRVRMAALWGCVEACRESCTGAG